MWLISTRRAAHRFRDQDAIPPWGLPLLLALACVVGAATVVVVARG